MTFHVPSNSRVREGRYGSTEEQGNNGAFILRLAHSQTLFAIASDGMGWEHVSVSRRDRCPTWAEMCAVKAMFWDDEDVVLQYHPRASEYVNVHQFCLHLWRPIGIEVPTPPPIFVG
jgi:hypothetical protein